MCDCNGGGIQSGQVGDLPKETVEDTIEIRALQKDYQQVEG